MSEARFALSAYADAAGITLASVSPDEVTLFVDFIHEQHSGAPGMFHGGQIGGLLEVAMDAVCRAPGGGSSYVATTMTVEYLRPALPARLHAAARIVRRGRQLAYVEAAAWQDDRAKPMALATANYVSAESVAAAPPD